MTSLWIMERARKLLGEVNGSIPFRSTKGTQFRLTDLQGR